MLKIFIRSNFFVVKEENELMEGFNLFVNQFIAMLLKKLYSTINSWLLLFVQIIIPITTVIIAVYSVRAWKAYDDLPALELSLDQFSTTMTIINGTSLSTMDYKDAYINITDNSTNHKIVDVLTEDVQEFVLKMVILYDTTFYTFFDTNWATFSCFPFRFVFFFACPV